MACNRHRAHLYVLPEDDANRQMANGFTLHPRLRQTTIQVLPIAGGWCKALAALSESHISQLQTYAERRLVLVIDFDHDFDTRLERFRALIPDPLKDRAFLLGTLSEPENLRADLGQDYESIGQNLCEDCVDDTSILWGHALLKHNQQELERLVEHVKPFLFN